MLTPQLDIDSGGLRTAVRAKTREKTMDALKLWENEHIVASPTGTLRAPVGTNFTGCEQLEYSEIRPSS